MGVGTEAMHRLEVHIWPEGQDVDNKCKHEGDHCKLSPKWDESRWLTPPLPPCPSTGLSKHEDPV